MATYNASDIVGKTLIAKKTIKIVRTPYDTATSVYNVQSGDSIGVVYSYLLPTTNRKNLYWQFYDSNNKPYYVEHKQGNFDIKSLDDQGVLTLEEKQEQAAAANETLTNKIFRYTKNGFLIAAAAYVLKTIIETQGKNK